MKEGSLEHTWEIPWMKLVNINLFDQLDSEGFLVNSPAKMKPDELFVGRMKPKPRKQNIFVDDLVITNTSIYVHLYPRSYQKALTMKDTFYISHGSPTLPIDDSLPARRFLVSWKEKVFPQIPKSILVISGHWDTGFPAVNIVQHNDTIHDFYGFPDPLYKLKYPAPGAPELALRVKELLMASGFGRVDEDRERGLDHGAWVPLFLMYPEANIPVCQLSVQSERDGNYHYNLGKALSPLKDEGVLIMGSGAATHNLEVLSQDLDGVVLPWASEFDSWLKDALLQGRYEDVNQYEEKAPHAKKAHPWPDHLYPLHVAMGAAGENAKAKLIHESWHLGSFSYASYQFTTPD